MPRPSATTKLPIIVLKVLEATCLFNSLLAILVANPSLSKLSLDPHSIHHPRKGAEDLLKLGNPVSWAICTIGNLRSLIRDQGTTASLSLLDGIRRYAVS